MTPLAFDLGVGLIILLSTLVAYFRGIIKEVFTLVGVGLAVLASYKIGHILKPDVGLLLGATPEGSKDVPPMVLDLVNANVATNIVSYGGVFLVVLVVMFMLRMLITRWIQEAGLGVADRLIGGGFGFVRGYVLVFAVYAVCFYLMTEDKMASWVRESHSAAAFNSTLKALDGKVDLKKFIKDEGDGIAIKLNKIDPDKIGQDDEKKDEEKKDESSSSEPSAAPVPSVEGREIGTPAPSTPEVVPGPAAETAPEEKPAEAPIESTPPPATEGGAPTVP